MMKIQNSEIEIMKTIENEPDCYSRQWTVQFIKTPRGRKKKLGYISEEFDTDSPEVIEISILFDEIKNAKEQKKILNYLIDNFSFHSQTLAVLQLPCVLDGNINSVSLSKDR